MDAQDPGRIAAAVGDAGGGVERDFLALGRGECECVGVGVQDGRASGSSFEVDRVTEGRAGVLVDLGRRRLSGYAMWVLGIIGYRSCLGAFVYDA